jgi:hypothetical protein
VSTRVYYAKFLETHKSVNSCILFMENSAYDQTGPKEKQRDTSYY